MSVLVTGALVLSGVTTALGAITDFAVAAGALLIIGGGAGLLLVTLLAVAWRRFGRRPQSLPGPAA